MASTSYSKTHFESLQKSSKDHRLALKTQQLQAQQLRSDLAKVNAKLQSELAKGDLRDSNTVAALQSSQSELQGKLGAAKAAIYAAEQGLADVIGHVVLDLDPRSQVGMLDDTIPVFLMPLRIETRFMTVKYIARLDPVRMNTLAPPQMTVIEGREVSVPRSIEVGRVFETYTELPVIEDSQELWVRAYPDDIAIHTHEQPLTELEVEAGKAFWTHYWRAGKEAETKGLRLGAWRGLVSGRGPQRAAWVARQMKPTNPADQPATQVADTDPLPVDPVFPSPALKDGSWTQMPHSRVMPDKLVVRLYHGNTYREVVGRHIPDPLPVSLDPNDLQDANVTGDDADFNNRDGKLDLPDKLRWMQDFDAAEKIGMGIRVPLTGWEPLIGFSKIIVLGVKTSATKTEAKDLLEDLIDNHHYTHAGFAIVPQGTPTNNTDSDKSGHTDDLSDDEALLEIELGDNVFTPNSDDHKKKDGQFLAEALGIDYEPLQHIRNGGFTDIKEAMCMNTALWPTTLGYYMKQMMHPIFSDADISRTRAHFQQFVLGRGRVPAIKVGSQPYGILATTAFSKLTYKGTDSHSLYLKGMFENVLQKMETTWDDLSSQVQHTGANVPPNEKERQFLDILGLHPASVEFYQRFVAGPYFLWNIYNYSRFINHSISQPQGVSYASSLQFYQEFLNSGYLYAYPPRVFDFTYVREHKYLNGPVIDRLKLSETREIEEMGSNGENYIDWLIKSNWNEIKAENFSNIGVPGAVPPNALLYLMLRHACLLSYVKTGINLLISEGILSANAYLDTELMNFNISNGVTPEVQGLVKAQVHLTAGMQYESDLNLKVQQEFQLRADQGLLDGMSLQDLESEKVAFKSELKEMSLPAFQEKLGELTNSALEGLQVPNSKTALLESSYEFLGGQLNLADYIIDAIHKPLVNKDVLEMQELISALECLKDLPTARLERLLAEHVDLAAYRLDAWFNSLAQERLYQQRKGTQRKTGVYIGAYGWLENIHPGSFKGIYYQEVDIQPTVITIPGYTDIAIEGVVLPGDIRTIEPWYFKANIGKLEAVSGNFKVASTEGGTAAPKSLKVESNATMNTDSLKETDQFGLVSELSFLGFMASGDKLLQINQGIGSMLVDIPSYADLPSVLDLGPQYTYLGTNEVGDIMYDAIIDKFTHSPRVDPSNQGYIHAPSINQATAAAVLRAGYTSHKGNPDSPDNAMAVNLSSDRVRQALFYLEGLRKGQELGALLGYQFERGLHDRDLGLDQHLLEFRLKFPLVAGRVSSVSGASSIRDAEAHNVVNGLALVEASAADGTGYPWGVVGLPATSGPQQTAIIAEVVKLHNALDAINDLLMSEAMYQVVQGNHSRAASSLNAMSGKGIPAEPQVINTPRSAYLLTHRTGLQFDLSPGGRTIWTVDGSARSVAEPALNRWLGEVFPDKTKIVFNYSYRFMAHDGLPGSSYGGVANAGQLGLEPIDLLAILSEPSDRGDAAELVERIGFYVRCKVLVAENVELSISFSDRTGLNSDDITLYELQPLMEQLKTVIGNSRALDAKDYMLATGAEALVAANPGKGIDTSLLLARLEDVIGITDPVGHTMTNGQRALEGVLLDLDTETNNLLAALAGPEGAVSGIDAYNGISTALFAAAAFGATNAIPVIAGLDPEATTQQLVVQAQRVKAELQDRWTKATASMTAAAAISNETLKAKALAEIAQTVYGRRFKVFPEFKVYNDVEVDAATQYSHYLDFAGEDAVSEWLQGLSPVRKRIHAWHEMDLLTQALSGNPGTLDLQLAQLPLLPLDSGGNPDVRWLGVQFPEDYAVPAEVLSLLFHLPSSYAASGYQAGLLIDEWVEEIPQRIAHTGVAVHYNNPNSEPAQVCLLAVSPDETGKWEWDDLMDTLNETLAWAKKRAVDPDLLNTTIYAQVLPAIYAAVSGTQDTPTLDFGRNIIKKPKPGVFDLIKLIDYGVLNLDVFNFNF